MQQNKIELRIKQLVLHDFSPADSQRIGVAMQQELTRLLARQGVNAAWSAKGGLVAVDGGSFNATAAATPNHIGSRVAECVSRCLGR